MTTQATRTATWRRESFEEKTFFYNALDDEGYPCRRRGYFSRTCISVTVPHAKGSDTIIFAKTNKGKMYHDSRTPRKPLKPDECQAELMRLLGPVDGPVAFANLHF